MNTDEHRSELPSPQLTREIIGAAMEVANEIGPGLWEKPYENALVIELGLRELACSQQSRFAVDYKGHNVGEYIPDLIVAGAVIVDAKTIDAITDQERGQMLNYLRIAQLRIGLIVNFKHAKLQWERIVL